MNLEIEIVNPHIQSERKLDLALEVLSKAFPDLVDYELNAAEETPYQALVDVTDGAHELVSDKLYQLWKDICKQWLHTELDKAVGDSNPYKLRGRTFINPKTRKLLTVGEWNQIKKDLTRVLRAIYDVDDVLIMRALAVGKILQSMDPTQAISATMKDLDVSAAMKIVGHDATYQRTIQYAKIHTGELIQDVTERSRRAIMRTILEGYNNGTGQRELASKLFDTFSVLNRDWRRIAETENAINFNNGYLLAELKASHGEMTFVKGISGNGACEFCRTHLDNQIFALLAEPPADGGDSIDVDGETYVAIWPGKNNFGRKRAEWWACFPSHPHCRCSSIQYYMKMREKIEEQMRSNMKK